MAERELSILLKLRDQASKELTAFGVKVKGMEPKFQKMAAGGTTALALLTGAIGASVAKASEMESIEIAFTTMLKSASAAKDMIAQLNEFAAKTPYEFQEIAQASKSLLAFGIPAKMMQEELKKIGDISSGIGAPIGEIAELYGKAKVQGRLFGEDINQLTGRGIPIIQELAKQFGVTEGKVKELVESGKVNFSHLSNAFASMSQQGGQFFNMMDAQSASAAGMWSTFQDSISATMRTVGMQFLPMLKDLMSAVTPLLEGFGAWAAAHPEIIKYTVLATAAIAAMTAVIGFAGIALLGLTTAASGFGLTLGAFLLPLALVTAAIVAIVGVMAWWVMNWKENVATMKWLWQGFSDFFIGIWKNIESYFTDVWVGIKAIFQESIDWMMQKIQPLLNAINTVQSGFSAVTGAVGSTAKWVGSAISVNDAIISPNGNIISTHPDDYLIATKDPYSLAGNGGGISINIYGDVSGMELVEKVKKALTLDIKRQIRL
ncbi:MAG TPA: phage tail tape measure protein [Candidatus Paceibacterota bacterium]